MNLTIRSIQSLAEFQSCVDLQYATWGDGSTEILPASMLQISQKLSGVAAGAFLENATLVGLVFGLTGFKHGCLHHWSHMLAVDPAYRDRGIGLRLKHFQRQLLDAIGVRSMSWTYDPLVARNAYLNLIKFGAEVMGYERDMYGDDSLSITDSIIGSDRLVVDWHFSDPERCHSVNSGFDDTLPIVNSAERSEEYLLPTFDGPDEPRGVRVEIPQDIQALKTVEPDTARAWRSTTRTAFEHYFSLGYRITDFSTAPDGKRAWYTLSKGEEDR